MAFFDHFFPVLGTQFGLGALGVFQGLYVFFFGFLRCLSELERTATELAPQFFPIILTSSRLSLHFSFSR